MSELKSASDSFSRSYTNSFFSKDSFFDKIRIKLSNQKNIIDESHGEILKPETINYRTFKPERDGLFCARIFGPVKDYECLCGKYKRMKYEGVVCEKCDVEVTVSRVRRERMAHISLVYPAVHTWFLHSLPSRIGLMLDLSVKDIEKVVYFESFIITEPGLTPLKKGNLISESEYSELLDQYGDDAFKAMSGAEAIKELLSSIDLEKECKELNKQLASSGSSLKRNAIVKRLSIFKNFLSSGNRPEWMILTVLPVLPPDLRPLVVLDGGKFASSDLNELYRRVINRNNRLRSIIDLGAPEIIIRNEKRMLQEAVDMLIDGNKRSTAQDNSDVRPLKSLSDVLRGKNGRFRQNLLGKRVDYSGRSVIVVGPHLSLNECGLPKIMALELFRPFVISKLELYGKFDSYRNTKGSIDTKDPLVWEILADIVNEYPILLNRAPTLHRLSIQAFEPKLVDSKAIQLHPLVCRAFNADFDGDQMAVHVPISIEAQMETRVLMMSTNNIISPSSNLPIITPDKDVVLGIYYITKSVTKKGEKESEAIFVSINEIYSALSEKKIRVNETINFVDLANSKDGQKTVVHKTTAGRVMLYKLLPEGQDQIPFLYFNRCFVKKDLENLFLEACKKFPQSIVVDLADGVLQLGFKNSTLSGISFGKDDIVIPQEKYSIIAESHEKIKDYEKKFSEGYITSGEKYNKVTDEWQTCIDKVTDKMMNEISKNSDTTDINSIYMMANSGARGSVAQIKQLAGMRGLMTKPNGEIIETPILSNFKEGLTVLEYFISAHGARKGLADTALKTADAGYLTRRLVDVSHNCIITEDDCKTEEGITMYPEFDGSTIVKKLSEIAKGRIALKDVKDRSEKVIIKAGSLLVSSNLSLLDEHAITSVEVRSVVLCKSKYGVCIKCYGKNLTDENLINIGDPVGIIAAQSIGEPGTQLTMRTFHVGGVAFKYLDKPIIQSGESGKLRLIDVVSVVNKNGESYVVNNNGEAVITTEEGPESRYKIPYGCKIVVKDGQTIKKGQIIYETDVYNTPIISEYSGTAELLDLKRDVSYREKEDEETGFSSRVVINSSLHPRVMLKNKNGSYVKNINNNNVSYFLSVSSVVLINDGEEVSVGDIIGRVPKAEQKSKDITGGLPRVVDLFEARKSKSSSILSECDGSVVEIKQYKSKKKVAVKPSDGSDLVEYNLPKDSHILVQDGYRVKKGDIIVDGEGNPHDILRIQGLKALISYMMQEIQAVYNLQGVKIDDRHIEVIIKYMLQKVVVKNPGDSDLVMFQKINKQELNSINDKLLQDGLKPVEADLILQGITDAALQTESFISAASFQETTKILTDAAIAGKVDELCGIKENVIVGKLIPVGTGFSTSKIAKKVLAESLNK